MRKRYFCALLLAGFVPALVQAEDVKLQVAVEGGAFNSKFKFFDASDGCPSYNDIPGAKDFMGDVFASGKGASKVLPTDTPIHIFLFKPRDTFAISAGGGQAEIRRRSLQVILDGDAELVVTGFEDGMPQWRASGGIDVERALACTATADPEADHPGADADDAQDLEHGGVEEGPEAGV